MFFICSMVDNIKIKLLNYSVESLESNELLNFCDEVNPDTGEMRTHNRQGRKITPHRSAFYKSLEFRIYYSGGAYLIGSLHKYWNNGQHNYNDFGTSDLVEVLNELLQLFNISPHQMLIQSIELGVNITPPYRTKKILDHVFFHRNERVKWCNQNTPSSYMQTTHMQYHVKIYDKARQDRKQHNIKGEIMRFEVKTRKMQKLGADHVKTMNDLLECGLENFIPLLIKEWNQVLLYDFTLPELHPRYSNQLEWQKMIDAPTNYTLHKHKRKYKELVKAKSDNLQGQIAHLIEQKATEVCQINKHSNNKNEEDKGVCIFTNIDNAECITKGYAFLPILAHQKNTKGYAFLPFNYKVKFHTPLSKVELSKISKWLGLLYEKNFRIISNIIFDFFHTSKTKIIYEKVTSC